MPTTMAEKALVDCLDAAPVNGTMPLL